MTDSRYRAPDALLGAPVGPELAKAATGIRGLDQITFGGLPRGRTTLVTGGAGSGKSLFGLTFLVAGARDHAEPGVLVTFEESGPKVAANCASLGYDLEGLQEKGLLVVHAFEVDPSTIIETGEFDLEPLFAVLEYTVERIGAKRVVLDTIELLFGAFETQAIVRAELARLFKWLEERELTAIVTSEQGENRLTRHGIEEYVSDCVVVLDHRVNAQVSTRRLRILKYRGSAHETNECPFLITAQGPAVLPLSSVSLDYAAPEERMSTGVERLDHMLSGGLYRASTTLVSGSAGTGKTTLAASVVDAACRRGERALWVLFEESPAQVLRNMRSVGLDLEPWVESGLLRFWAARPSAFGLEMHLAILEHLLDDARPTVVVLDGLFGLHFGISRNEGTSMVFRQLHLLKSRGITAVITSLEYREETGLGISSVIDSWIRLLHVESGGEANRLLAVSKSRGTAHSNQIREFRLTDHGVELVDVYVGSEGVFSGAARIQQETRERHQAREAAEDLTRRHRALRRLILEEEAQLGLLQEQLIANREELDALTNVARDRIDDRESGELAMAAQRWADPHGRSTGDDRD